MPAIHKVLIANRGEIALRIIRTCRERGIKTVAVFSRPDASAPHVLAADESVFIGEAASSESYLVIDKIIDAARETGADAIHPGYGFLSENSSFGKRCEDEGIIFIGPDSHAIEVMGDKTKARELMARAGVPFPPGTENAMDDVDVARKVADEIGYPVLIKAAAGGGGKGMRIVENRDDFEKSVKAARSEAKNAFGDDRVYVEKYLEEPRHIEFQVMADNHGNIVHLFERECSIQRR
ncbi:MAG: ATP-grasp domain-containing protein, partial [Balneolaceae bacterium]|nr:ATP-grasp domain-containing protein [Balneolaceae bacterium]